MAKEVAIANMAMADEKHMIIVTVMERVVDVEVMEQLGKTLLVEMLGRKQQQQPIVPIVNRWLEGRELPKNKRQDR